MAPREAGLSAITICELTCPQCGHVSVETMPTDACIYFHECVSCRMTLRPKAGDCCVFCSYGSVPCPPVQMDRACCGRAVEQLRAAFAGLDFSLLEPTLADDVRFGSCVGRPQVVELLTRVLRSGVAIRHAEMEVHPDRAIVSLELQAPDPQQLPFGRGAHFAVFFLRNDQVIELQVVKDREQARAAMLSPSPPPQPQAQTRLNAMAAVLPVRDLAIALEHYQRLGFRVSAYRGGGYGYAERDGLKLHLKVVPGLDPATTTSAVYSYVDDADLLFAQWRSAGVSGQFFEPHDTEYGLRVGAHIDRDGNLIRFGSALPDRA